MSVTAADYLSPLGPILLAADGDYLVGLWFQGQKHFPHLTANGFSSVLGETCRWLDLYFQGSMPDFTPPVLLRGTPFQQDVWRILQTIPYGHTTTYGQIARQLAQERGLPHLSAQAVGGAVGRNPISIIVPCHRVVGAGGAFTGYAGGVDRKVALLHLEGLPLYKSGVSLGCPDNNA